MISILHIACKFRSNFQSRRIWLRKRNGACRGNNEVFASLINWNETSKFSLAELKITESSRQSIKAIEFQNFIYNMQNGW